MKVGTILRNDCVSESHPFRRSIYIGKNGRYANFIYSHNGKIEKGKYFYPDIGKTIIPERETDVLKRIAQMLEDEQKNECPV